MGHIRERPSREALRTDTRRAQAASEGRSAVAACGEHRRTVSENLGESLMTRLRIFECRLSALFRSRRMDRKLDDAMASQIAEANEEYVEQGRSLQAERGVARRS